MFHQVTQHKFLHTFKQLNRHQRAAVETIEGPVLALAGPGTGKTHVLTTRIGHILNSTDTEPQNILCLTFTDAAVLSMRQKLVRLIGSIGHQVPIYTYHSFCNKIIKENIEQFGNHYLQAISSLERLEIIRQIIDSLADDNPLRKHKNAPYFYENHLGSLFQTIKKENWSEAQILNKIESFLSDLPQREQLRYKRKTGPFKKGDLKVAAFEKITLKVTLLLHAISLYKQYQTLLAKHEYYDFEDMILWVTQAFDNEPMLLRQYQEQFQYLMVDEFQDTNAGQSKIIKQLMAYWDDNPNLFIVGDDDQSIYEFQGARLKNLTDLMERYQKHLKVIHLNQNYRSSQLILDVAKESIDHNTVRVAGQLQNSAQGKYLKASLSEVANLENTVNITEFDNPWQEEIGLMQAIKQHQQEGVALQTVAILFAKHKQAQALIALLDKKGIPYQIKKKKDILELPLMYNLRKLMRFLIQNYRRPYQGDAVLYELLHLNFLSIDSADISKMAQYLRVEEIAGRFDKSWLRLISDEKLLSKIGLLEPSSILQFSRFIYGFNAEIQNLNLLDLLEYIVHKSGLSQFLFRQENRLNRLKIISSFLDFAKDAFEKNHRLSLSQLLDQLDLMQSNNLALNMLEMNTMQEGVQLITAHSAKGLEFDYVYLMDVNEKEWGLSKSNKQQFYYPDTLTFSNESDALEARRRLFYVALTRARKYLHISYSKKNRKGKNQQKLQFIDEIDVANSKIIRKKQAINFDDNWQILLLSENKIVPHRQESKAYIDSLLEDFKMTISALNSYLYCASSFYFEYILKIPRQKSLDALIGDCWHRSIQQIFIYRNNNAKFPSISWVRKQYKHDFKRIKHLINTPSNKKRASSSEQRFVDYYKSRRQNWLKISAYKTVITEKAIWNASCDGVPLRGIVDKIELDKKSNSLEIIDYKYSSYDRKKLLPAKKEAQVGGSYWRQLYFYKLLVEGSGLYTQNTTRAGIDFMQKNNKQVFEQQNIIFELNELNRMKAILKDSYQRIMNQEFSDGCGKESCNWCNFIKNNERLSNFKQPIIEELDDAL